MARSALTDCLFGLGDVIPHYKINVWGLVRNPMEMKGIKGRVQGLDDKKLKA